MQYIGRVNKRFHTYFGFIVLQKAILTKDEECHDHQFNQLLCQKTPTIFTNYTRYQKTSLIILKI